MSEAPTEASTGPGVRAPNARRRILFLGALVLVLVDLVSKVLAENRLNETSVDLGVLQLQLAHNDGVAFSVGTALPSWVVLAVTATITVGIGIYGWRHAPSANRVQILAGAAILGGATANVIDRAGDGVVTDYLHTGWWPTFNLADAFLVLGVAALIADQFYAEWRSRATTSDHPEPGPPENPPPSKERGPDRPSEP